MKNYNQVGTARITTRGILFLNLFYSCGRAISEQWYEIAAQIGDRIIEVRYDPSDLSSILIKVVVDQDVEFESAQVLARKELHGSKLEKYFESIQKLKALRNRIRKEKSLFEQT
jgi:hypothetical protein